MSGIRLDLKYDDDCDNCSRPVRYIHAEVDLDLDVMTYIRLVRLCEVHGAP